MFTNYITQMKEHLATIMNLLIKNKNISVNISIIIMSRLSK